MATPVDQEQRQDQGADADGLAHFACPVCYPQIEDDNPTGLMSLCGKKLRGDRCHGSKPICVVCSDLRTSHTMRHMQGSRG